MKKKETPKHKYILSIKHNGKSRQKKAYKPQNNFQDFYQDTFLMCLCWYRFNKQTNEQKRKSL